MPTELFPGGWDGSTLPSPLATALSLLYVVDIFIMPAHVQQLFLITILVPGREKVEIIYTEF